jgi:hypothetical protein
MARFKNAEAGPVSHAVRIVRNGIAYDGSYVVSGPMITVSSPVLGSKTMQISGTSPEALAKIILTEMLFLDDERHGK